MAEAATRYLCNKSILPGTPEPRKMMRMMPLFVTVNREVLYAPPPCEMGLIMLRHQTRTFGFGRMRRRRRRHLTVIAPWAMATGIQSAGRSMWKEEPPACQDQILARVGLRRRANVKAAPRENGGRTKRDTGNAIAILSPVCLSLSAGWMPDRSANLNCRRRTCLR